MMELPVPITVPAPTPDLVTNVSMRAASSSAIDVPAAKKVAPS